jgi:NAD-dependent SIR2 family protein deacetylase
MLKDHFIIVLFPLLLFSRCFCQDTVPSDRVSSCPVSLTTDRGADDEKHYHGLHQKQLREVAKLIVKSQNILVVSGAGVSVSAGIPDFRSPRIGLYDNLAQYDLPYPEAIFDLEFYRQNPKPFVALSHDFFPAVNKAQPSLTHLFFKALHDHNKLLRIYTQNIDGLDLRAGTPHDKVIECHGHFRTASCSVCGKAAPIDSVLKAMVEEARVPLCEACGNPVKPDITFFGQELPSIFSKNIEPDTDKADLLLVFGTSLNVAPVSLIPSFVGHDVPRVLFNREYVAMSDKVKPERDVFVEGDCDANVKTLIQFLNWRPDV